MKKILATASVLLLLITVSKSYALDVRPYFDLHAGAIAANDSDLNSNSKVSYDPGLVTGGAIGLDFELLRLEVNVDYRRASISQIDSAPVSGTIQLINYMLNAHLVPPLQSPVKPYILLGAGLATAMVDNNNNKERDTKFSYEFGAGLGFDIKRNVTIDINYRYMGTSDFNLNVNKLSYTTNNVLLGVRYSY